MNKTVFNKSKFCNSRASSTKERGIKCFCNWHLKIKFMVCVCFGMHAIFSLNKNIGLHLGRFKSMDKITHTKMGPLLGAFKKLVLRDRAFTLSEPGEMKEDKFTSKVKNCMLLRRNSGNPSSWSPDSR